MVEALITNNNKVEEIIQRFNLGLQYYDDGYEDMGFGIEYDALLDACKLNNENRKKIFDILFPYIK